MAVLESGVFSGVPAVTTLNLNHNLLETLTYNNVLPIMDNLVNNTFSVLSISGKGYYSIIFLKLKYLGWNTQFGCTVHIHREIVQEIRAQIHTKDLPTVLI